MIDFNLILTNLINITLKIISTSIFDFRYNHRRDKKAVILNKNQFLNFNIN
jgi:hypothetical protein